VTANWQLEAADIEAVAALLGPDGLRSRRVIVTKGYDNRLRWQVDIDERRVVSHLVRSAPLESDEARSLWTAATVAELAHTLRGLESPSPAQAALLSVIDERFPDGDAARPVVAVLQPRLPRFLYFAEYHRLPAEVSVDDLLRRRAAGQLTIGDNVFPM